MLFQPFDIIRAVSERVLLPPHQPVISVTEGILAQVVPLSLQQPTTESPPEKKRTNISATTPEVPKLKHGVVPRRDFALQCRGNIKYHEGSSSNGRRKSNKENGNSRQ